MKVKSGTGAVKDLKVGFPVAQGPNRVLINPFRNMIRMPRPVRIANLGRVTADLVGRLARARREGGNAQGEICYLEKALKTEGENRLRRKRGAEAGASLVVLPGESECG